MSEETIFQAALAKEPAERAAFLDAACGGDEALRRAVEGLLASHEQAGDFLDRPAYDRPAASTQTSADTGAAAATRIGPYILERVLGDGGMGRVWVARQTEPVKRRVALKLIKAGMDSAAVLGRFEQERQALALMDHPNIARVIDGGVTADGRPFFVMELVNGLALTKFCDEAKLTPQQRLELFMPICQAVQHAHQKGIVHRDLKPANILVTLYDGKPVPKIIDFGIAKALSGKLTDAALTTGFGGVVGTLEYMAPEQAGFSALDVDTRADIYALGVILYELLTGRRPIDGKRLRSAAIVEMIRILQDEEPPRPSKCLSTDDALPSLAALRQMEPRRLTAMVRGDLDCIVMKCLEKSRERRYETANGLVRDIQRYLADEPVEARPPSLRYRAGKFLRRNRPTVVAATLVMLALLGGITGTTTAMFAAWRQADLARQAAEDAERAGQAEAIAKANEEKAKQDALAKLWVAYLSEANARRHSRLAGQRFASLDAIVAALKLPVPPGHSQDELRDAAIAALSLPDIYDGPEWATACPSSNVAFDTSGQRYVQVDGHGHAYYCRFVNGKEERSAEQLVDGTPGGGDWHSPDLRFLALSSPHIDGRGHDWVKLWRCDGPKAKLVLHDRDGVSGDATAFSPDGRYFAVGHPNGKLTVYDCATGAVLRRWQLGSRPMAAAFHPRVPRLAVACGVAVQMYDVDSGLQLPMRLTHDTDVFSVAWHPDGRQVATGAGRNIRVWDSQTGRPVLPPLKVPANGGIRVRLNARGDRLLSSDWSNVLRLWDATSGKELFSTPGHASPPQLCGQDQFAVPVGAGKTVRLLRFAAGHEHRVFDANTPATVDSELDSLCYPLGQLLGLPLPTGRFITFDGSGALVSRNDLGVFRWPIRVEAGPTNRYHVGPPERLTPVAGTEEFSCSRDGRVLAFAHGTHATVVYLGPVARTLTVGPQYDVRVVTVSPDGHWILTGSHWSDGSGEYAKVWDSQTGKLARVLPIPNSTRPSFNPTGQWVHAWYGSNGHWHAVGSWEPRAIDCPAGVLAPDGHLLASISEYGEVRLLNFATGNAIARLRIPDQTRLFPFTYSPDGSYLYARGDQSFYRWDLRLIRRQLAAIGLDWDLPPYPQAVEQPVSWRAPLDVVVHHAELAQDRRALHQHELAQAALALRANPFDAAAHALVGAIALEQDRWEVAFAHLTMARALRPDDFEVRRRRAIAARFARRWDEAVRDADWVLQIQPDHLHALQVRGVALQQLGRHAEAIQAITALLRFTPRSSALYEQRAQCHEALKDQPRADADRARAARVTPDNPHDLNRLAWALVAGPTTQRDPARALRLAQKAVALAPEEADYVNTLGVAQYRNALYEDSVATLTRSLELGKGRLAAADLFFLAMAHHQIGATHKASDCYEHAVRWVADNPNLAPQHQDELRRIRTEADSVLGRSGR